MDPTVEAAWSVAEKAEKDLLTTLALKDPTFADIDHLIAQYRSASENVLFLDFEFATSKRAEGHLWDGHGRINARYRKQLSKFGEENGKKKPVEKRKLQKHYVNFVKSSTRFYRGYIQRLASHFGGIPEVQDIAKKFNLDNLAADPPVETSVELQRLILSSCHATLVRLGDLSRYRETELKTQDRNWGPAIGYYDLAGAILPSSGASFNQLAVIAVTDGNHLKALYNLYRALSAEDPYPAARGNLEIEFKKILSAWSKGQLIHPQDQNKPGKALEAWFTCLHARCYKGVDFSEHDELENEVLSQLSVDLKERALHSVLQKFSLINIAAEHLASMRAQTEPNSAERHLRSFVFFQRFNIKIFFTLLQILLPELEQFAVDDSSIDRDDRPRNSSDKVTAIARRVLPTLRQYSSWLQSSAHILVAQESDPFIGIQIKEFWKIYATTLSFLAATFPLGELPEVNYLLEEDTDTLGFKPLQNENTSTRYYVETADGIKLKPKCQDGLEQHHPNVEMLFRIREILADGVRLALRQNDYSVPIALADDGTRFEYQEDGLPAELLNSHPGALRPYGHGHSQSTTSIGREDIELAKQNGIGYPEAASIADEDASQSASMSVTANTALNRMVDDIVGSESSGNVPVRSSFPQIQNGDSPPTPHGRTFGGDDAMEDSRGTNSSFDNFHTTTARQLLERMQTTPVGTISAQSMERQETAQPSLPGLFPFNTPFAPLPGETTSSPQTRPSTARKNSSPRGSQEFQFQQTAVSGSTRFQDELRRRYEMPSSSMGTVPEPSSWSNQSPSQQENYRPAQYQRAFWMKPASVAPTVSASPSTQDFYSSDLPRQNLQAKFGAIGQTPPSGQGG